MDTASYASGRKAFLSRVAEQFRELAEEIGSPYRVEVWGGDNAADAGFRVVREWEGEKREILQVIARFDDAAAGREGWREKVILSWQLCEGEVNEILGLGWSGSLPDAAEGLNSPADHIDDASAYAMGKVTQALRADVISALKAQPGFVVRLPVPRQRSEPVSVADTSFDEGEHAARGRHEPAARRAAGKSVTAEEESDLAVLQASLGELAAKGGLRAEKVFPVFIRAARDGARLQQGNVRMSLQRAMLRLYLFQQAYLEEPVLRPARMRSEDGPLVDAVLKREAVLYQQPGGVQDNVAGEMVMAMRAFYEAALRRKGVAEDIASEMVKSAFGNAGGIVNAAVAGFRDSLPRSWARFTRLLPRPNSLE
jgi:hypothetical protein